MNKRFEDVLRAAFFAGARAVESGNDTDPDEAAAQALPWEEWVERKYLAYREEQLP